MCLALFCICIEAVLALAGFTPVVETADPYVGFSSWIPLFEPVSDAPELRETSVNKLTFFNQQRFAARKSADGFRIFTVGGSTTYGRPYDDTTSFSGWLRRLLPRADGSRNWEIINAGGISYASYRVARVMEELSEFEPDLFVVYCGHNEFLEERTYRDQKQTSSILTTIGGIASHTRIYAAMQSALHAAPAARSAVSESQLPAEVVTLLDSSVGPNGYRRNQKLKIQIQNHYEINLRRMVSIARATGARILFVVPASNLRDSSPFKSEYSALVTPQQKRQIANYVRSAERLSAEGKTEQALFQIENALAIDSKLSTLHYRRGQLLYSMEKFDAAREAFNLAVEEDICPLRILAEMQDSVRRVATELNVSCIDFAELVERKAKNGIPGRDLFLDHVHPNIRTNRLLALAIIDELAAMEIVTLSADWTPATVEDVTRELEGGLDKTAHGIALRNLSRVLGWAGKTDEAYNLALEAVQLAPEDAETLFQAGIAYEGAGQLDQAEQHYRQAGKLDPDYEAVYLNLGVVLGKLERYEEAKAEFLVGLRRTPDSPALLNNLATVCELLKEFDEARTYRERAADTLRMQKTKLRN